jgi:predicted nucleic acid-binding protein
VRAVVLDASALVEYLLGTDLGLNAASIIEQPEVDLRTPALCDIELTSALRGLVISRKIAIDRALEAVEDYGDLPITRHEHLDLLQRVLALRANFSAYDATYVALAEELEAELLTCDEPLARAVRTHLPCLRVV